MMRRRNSKKVLTGASIEFIDFGTNVKTDCDYAYYIEQAVSSIRDKTCDFAFSFCRTGQGVNMCANKFQSIRSALVYDDFSAKMAIRHNCANFFSFPERLFASKRKVQTSIKYFIRKHF